MWSFAACSPPVVSLLNTSDSTLRPFYPLYYNNLRCTWLITAPRRQIVKFWFTEYGLSQPGDYLEVRDGVDDSALLVKNFTTKPDLNERWASSSSYLWIKFESNEDLVSTGFDLSFKFVKKTKGIQTFEKYP